MANILFVHEVNYLTKVVYEIQDLAETLAANGNKVVFVDYETDYRKRGPFINLNPSNLKTKVFENVKRSYGGKSIKIVRPGLYGIWGVDRFSAWLTNFIEINKIIKKENIDCIILYSVFTNGLQSIYWAKRHKIPVMFRSIDVVHELLPPYYRWLKPLGVEVEKVIYRSADKILAMTERMGDFAKRMGTANDNIVSLPLAVNLKLFRPMKKDSNLMEKYGINPDDKVIMFVGTLYDFSGVDKFVEMMPKILKVLPNTKLIMVGDGRIRNKIENIAKELKIEKNVIVTGFQEYQMVPKFIALSNVCINTFQYNRITRDILPIKILQYMGCKKPVVATDLPGIKTIIGEQNGVVYAKNIDDFVSKTIKLLNNDKIVEKISEAGYKYVKGKHNLDKIAKSLEKIIIESKSN